MPVSKSYFTTCAPTYLIKMLEDQGLKPHSALFWMGLALFAITRPGLSTAKDVLPIVDSDGHAVPHTLLVCYYYSLPDINPKLSSPPPEPSILSRSPFTDVVWRVMVEAWRRHWLRGIHLSGGLSLDL